jgi:hypothetical protein
MAERAIEIGKTYLFNQATAKVVNLTFEMVGWKEPRVRGRNPIHWVPRWFFEKHARMMPPLNRYHATAGQGGLKP